MHVSVISSEGLEMYVHDIPASIQPAKELIDLSQLARGIYFIRVTSNQQTHVGKLILD
jgi:hypothetical protein